jgi:co-chaperonin GroES (HSP10)
MTIDVSKLRPKADNVLVRMDMHANRTVEEVTAGGIILPKSREVASNEGAIATVVAAGPGYHPDKWLGHEKGTAPVGVVGFIPMDPDIKPGARVVLISPHTGDRVYDDEREEYRMVRAENIMAVVE